MSAQDPQKVFFSKLSFFLIMREGKFNDGFLKLGDEFIGFLAPVRQMEGDTIATYELKIIDAEERALRAMREAGEVFGKEVRDGE